MGQIGFRPCPARQLPRYHGLMGNVQDAINRVILSKNKVITPRFIRIYITTYENKRGRGHGTVKGKPEERAAQLALYMIENKQTVRGAAKAFGISKSTVHTVVC